MLNQPDLSSLNKGDSIDHFLLVKKCEIRLTKNNKEYLSLELGDKTISCPSNLWEDVSGFKSIKNSLTVGDIVKIEGSMDEYQGGAQIKIETIRLSKQSDNVSHTDFLPKSLRDLKTMKGEFLSRLEKITDTNLKQLMKNIFSDERFEKYTLVPAGKMWHHSYISGLIEHTLEIIKICELMSDIHPEINRDLLVCGAMLHDFGKIEELTYEPVFEYTEGMQRGLVGHHGLGRDRIDVALVHRVQRQRHEADRQRRVLLLLHQLGDPLAALELPAGGLVEVGGELREGGPLTYNASSLM